MLEYAKSNPGGIAPGETPSKAKLYDLGVKAHEAGFQSGAGITNALIAQGVQPASAASIGQSITTWGVERAKELAAPAAVPTIVERMAAKLRAPPLKSAFPFQTPRIENLSAFRREIKRVSFDC